MAAIEIELRARFNQEEHDRLAVFLAANAKDLGVDDKNIYFYLLDNQLLKVVDNTAQGTAKISFKGNRIGQGSSFSEIDITIDPKDVSDAVRMFNELGFKDTMHQAFNQRRNFLYREVEIALKVSEAWGPHAEFEVLLPETATDQDKAAAETKIHEVARELDVHIMTEAELAKFDQDFREAQTAKQH